MKEGEPDFGAQAISTRTRVLAELLMQRVQLDRGHWRLTVDAMDGRVRSLRREENVPATAVDRFDQAREL